MQVPIRYLCSECESEQPKVITLFTREHYCGRFCLAEGQLKYVRMILRTNPEEFDHG